MFELIALVVLVALSGTILLPLSVLLLARFGYFEPIYFDAFGKRWSFRPRKNRAVGFSGATWSAPIRQSAFAGVASVVLTIGAPHMSVNVAGAASGSSATTIIAVQKTRN
jgi:hypothetical protein